MFAARVGVIVAFLVVSVGATSLRGPRDAVAKGNAPGNHARQGPARANATESSVAIGGNRESEVVAVRAKLQKMVAGLSAIMGANGALSRSPIAASIHAFKSQLQDTLNRTTHTTDAAEALSQLRGAQAAVKSLVRDMTLQQVRLMRDGDQQLQSLLLGVLMTRQHEPMEKQLEVLRSPEFQRLPVVAAVLALKTDAKTPLFQLVAKQIDGCNSSGNAAGVAIEAPVAKVKIGKNGRPDMSPIIAALEARIQHIETTDTHRVGLHADEMKQMDEAVEKEKKKKNSKLAGRFAHLKKMSDRKFRKEEALVRHDVDSLKQAVEAIRRGDLSTLRNAQTALQASLEDAQSHGNGFVVFIQMVHRLEGLDCPYCAAQCIEKCNAGGRSYTACLTDCAAAGK